MRGIRAAAQDWQFDPLEFASISREVGGFNYDACADPAGLNAMCADFGSKKEEALSTGGAPLTR